MFTGSVYFHSTDWVLARHAPNATPVKIINRMKMRNALNTEIFILLLVVVSRAVGLFALEL